MNFRGALVAVSGGVDSALALARSARRYPGRTRACYLDTCGSGPHPSVAEIAERTGTPLEVVPASDLFRTEVVSRSSDMLARGLTPNPCSFCNRDIKFGILSEMLGPGETLVTGHYVRKGPGANSILRGVDHLKDQSYFLSLVPGSMLERCSFPLGGMTKDRVRSEADALGLPYRQRESMDLCFDPGGEQPLQTPGRMVDTDGRDHGSHPDIGSFTIGQRVRLPSLSSRMYVLGKDMASGILLVGSASDLERDRCPVTSVNWFSGAPPDRGRALTGQIRYRSPAVPVSLRIKGDGTVLARFETPVRGVAPGQVFAVYLNDELLGGGLISTPRKEHG